MKKMTKARLVKLGAVTRQTRASTMIGNDEFGSLVYHWPS